MTALDAHRDVLKELDKFESPTFEIKDFNYFFNKAVSEYVNDNYKQFDIVQKDIDDIRTALSLNTPLEMSNLGLVTLPADYRHILGARIRVKFSKNLGRYKTNEIIDFFPERMKSGQKGFRQRNAFGRPNFKRYYYELGPTTFQLLYDPASVSIPTGTNLYMDYVRMMPEVYLNPNTASDYNNPTNNSILFFSVGSTRTHVYYEIVNVCRKIFLENIESIRAQEALRQSVSQ